MQGQGEAWHREVITNAVAETLRDLQGNSVLSSFYLGGGTGLALYLGHRRSRDLDFFSREEFDEDRLLQKVQQRAGFSLIAKDAQTLHVHIGGIKVSFLGYSYPVLFPPVSFIGVAVADPHDIACMKVSAIAARGTKRDFVDLYAASERYGLPEILEMFAQKYAEANYSRVHVLKSLTYFDDAEADPMPDMVSPLSWEVVKRFFVKQAPLLL